MAPNVSKSFGGTFDVGGTTLLTIDIANPSSTQALTGVGLVDNLPSTANGQMSIYNTGGTMQSLSGCGSAAASFPNGATTYTLSNATIAPNGTCTIEMTVTASGTGTYNNTTNPVMTSQGTFGTAFASVTVGQMPIP